MLCIRKTIVLTSSHWQRWKMPFRLEDKRRLISHSHKSRESSSLMSKHERRWNLPLNCATMKSYLVEKVCEKKRFTHPPFLHCRHWLRQLRAHSSRWRQVSLLATDTRNEIRVRRARRESCRLIRRGIWGKVVRKAYRAYNDLIASWIMAPCKYTSFFAGIAIRRGHSGRGGARRPRAPRFG